MATNHPLAKYRAERQITQEVLAQELRVTPTTISRYETGERTPRPKDARRISDHTGISVGDLIIGALSSTERKSHVDHQE